MQTFSLGSTTIEAIVVDAMGASVGQDYQRQEARQPEKLLEVLRTLDSSGSDRCSEQAHIGSELPTNRSEPC